jgi:hypothetical protein
MYDNPANEMTIGAYAHNPTIRWENDTPKG